MRWVGHAAGAHIRMLNESELPENVAKMTYCSRCWNGVNVHLVEYACTGRVLFKLDQGEESARIGAQLEDVGRDRAEPRSAPTTPNPNNYRPRSLYFAPAKMELWGHSTDARYLRCGRLSFDAGLLQERLGISGSPGSTDVPRLRFSDDRLWTLIKLLTDAIHESDPTAQLYGDSLTAAVAARLFEQPPKQIKGSERGLSTVQLKDAMSYLEANMPARVDLATLADLAGLSQSHYSRAFKASTGLAPYQWQLQARVERAKDLLLNTNGCLEDVADATGFVDAVHFGRTFRKMTGATPGAWRMDRIT